MKLIVFTIADNNNLTYAKGLENSFKKFHPDLEFRIFGEKEIKEISDPLLFYRATPYFGLYLLEQGYDVVIKLDADQVITGDISHVWEGEFDVATVHNSNPKELAKIVVALQGIDPLEYQNCGFVVMKNKEFVKHWLSLCMTPRFNAFQYREQDILNNLIFWGRYNCKFLDRDCENYLHGLVTRGFELEMDIKDDKLVLPDGKQVVCWHQAGGNVTNKMNFNLLFKPHVAKWLNKLVK